MGTEQEIRAKYRALLPAMDERHRRMWAGTEARALGRGGIAVVTRAIGLARNTIVRGLAELAPKKPLDLSRIRRSGAGRKRATLLVPGLTTALEELVEPVTRGDPESPLRWTCKSTRHLAEELNSVWCFSKMACLNDVSLWRSRPALRRNRLNQSGARMVGLATVLLEATPQRGNLRLRR